MRVSLAALPSDPRYLGQRRNVASMSTEVTSCVSLPASPALSSRDLVSKVGGSILTFHISSSNIRAVVEDPTAFQSQGLETCCQYMIRFRM